MNAIRQKHTELLARSFKGKVVKKFNSCENDYIKKGKFDDLKRPIMPIKNQRIDMLSVPLRVTPKFQVLSEDSSTNVNRTALETVCTPRLDHLSRPTLRFLKAMKNERKHLGKAFLDVMNDRIAMSLDTIYYHNIKSLNNIAESKKLPPKRPKYWDEVGDHDRMKIIALPNPPRKPAPLPRRKRKKIEELKAGIDRMAVPIRVYIRPSQESVVRRLKINPFALTYEASDRIKIISKTPAIKMFVPYVFEGYVKENALHYKASERMKELAVPHKRTEAQDLDVKEKPYDINPNALKYKPTPRIIQLAKPNSRK